ncbi:TPA: zinc-finger domain-containing protein, partial [Neisseria meningitidis]
GEGLFCKGLCPYCGTRYRLDGKMPHHHYA